jgi:hypothetical protein
MVEKEKNGKRVHCFSFGFCEAVFSVRVVSDQDQ